MISNTAEIMSRGMQCLRQQLGAVEAEQFISVIIREQFDYTKWHRTAFDDMTLKEFNASAAEYAGAHPFKGAGQVI